MKLILIYGPPAVGKLTIAKEVAKKTGFKLFHNHLTIDLVCSVFPFGTVQFAELLEMIRLMVIEEVAKSDIDFIFTLVYGAETFKRFRDDDFINSIIETVEKHKGEVCFVKLTCSKKEQFKRLGEESRKVYTKLTDPKVLEEIEKEFKLDEKIPFVKSLVIDTTELLPNESADKIIKSLKLKNQRKTKSESDK